MSVPIENLQLENTVKFTGLLFVSTTCTIDSCTVSQSNIYV